MVLKGIFGTLIGVVIGGHVINKISSTASIPLGIGKATQTLVGVAILGNSIKNTNKLFKLK